LQARANLEYQFTKKFGIFATGGYGLTRFYNKSSNYDKGAIIEAGIVLF
jgi:succinate dehydrogenase/fumarate reductase flavoprotein subunit